AYSSLAGGKRIRAMLVYMAANACQADNAPTAAMTDTAAAAIELVHCYSLIHDDLPAMDDDDLRRGKPSCHVQFGEANAILAGDALQTLAFELLANEGDGKAELRIGLVRELSRASGANGMVGGQAIDLAVVNQNISYDELVNMHALKTGALIDAATHMGCLCAGGNSEQAKALRHYAQAIGLAFQVQDDILDIEGSSEQTGKPQGTDIAANKPTYPAIMGLSEAKAKAQSLCDEALEALTDFGANADPLRSLATYIIQRSV
ncbi:MAG TPA: geranyl transferase, partial [Cellvibrionales bacterium]|nr:geranyl transferase [Cellvibrionales bacterium]